MKKIILLLGVLTVVTNGYGQRETLLSQYMFNELFLNPAYAGSHSYFRTSLLYRNQWVSFDGAPVNYVFSVDGPISNDKMGVGIIVSNQRMGITNETNVDLNYAYHLKLSESGKLSFGLRGGLSVVRSNFDQLVYSDSGDPLYSENVDVKHIPRMGFGTYYHTSKFYVGFSIPHLLAYEPGLQFSLNDKVASRFRRHYYLDAGYVYEINEMFKVKPTMLVRYAPGAPIQADFNTSVMYNNLVWLGLSYRTGDAIVALIEYKTNLRFRVGYSYDITLSEIRKYSGGTHEIMVGYDFGKDFSFKKTMPSFF